MYYFTIIYSSSKHDVDWNEAKPTTYNAVSCSLDNSKVIMSWSGSNTFPTSIANLPYKEGPYIGKEVRDLVKGPEWKAQ